MSAEAGLSRVEAFLSFIRITDVQQAQRCHLWNKCDLQCAPLPSACPLPLTAVWPLPMTALQYEIELIVVFFNMASLKKSINSLESRFSPRCSGRPRCKMQIGFIDRPSFYCTVMNTVTSPSLSLHGITLSFYFFNVSVKLPDVMWYSWIRFLGHIRTLECWNSYLKMLKKNKEITLGSFKECCIFKKHWRKGQETFLDISGFVLFCYLFCLYKGVLLVAATLILR